MINMVFASGIASGNSASNNPVAVIETSKGTIRVELFANCAPKTVENFVRYANDGFYNGLIFHRVIPDFMVQGGGFLPGMQQKQPTYSPIQNEAATSKHRNLRGTIAMARTSDAHSATSQFFINHAVNNFLDWDESRDGWGYCVFGTVIEGMNVVDSIAAVQTATVGGHENVPVEDVKITRVTIVDPSPSPSNGGETINESGTQPFYKSFLFLQIIGSLAVAGVIIAVLRFKGRKEEES